MKVVEFLGIMVLFCLWLKLFYDYNHMGGKPMLKLVNHHHECECGTWRHSDPSCEDTERRTCPLCEGAPTDAAWEGIEAYRALGRASR